jgi:hypothetical protein
MNNLFIQINELPSEIINLVKEYIPKTTLVFLNKTNYILYHFLLKKNIKNYENYVRDIIRKDNYFVFENIIKDNYEKWLQNKNCIYKNMIFKNYIYFILYFCIENESSKCRYFIIHFFKKLGMCKNLHKKNIVKYIR